MSFGFRFFISKFASFLTQIDFALLYFVHSQSNTGNDGWNGFDTDFEQSSYQSATNSEPQIGSAATSTKKPHRNEKVEKNDFSALDVKASKPTKTNKAKSIEDDAWNLLNNWINNYISIFRLIWMKLLFKVYSVRAKFEDFFFFFFGRMKNIFKCDHLIEILINDVIY